MSRYHCATANFEIHQFSVRTQTQEQIVLSVLLLPILDHSKAKISPFVDGRPKRGSLQTEFLYKAKTLLTKFVRPVALLSTIFNN